MFRFGAGNISSPFDDLSVALRAGGDGGVQARTWAEDLSRQFRHGEFIGDPAVDPNPNCSAKVEAELLEAGRRSLDPSTADKKQLSDLAEQYISIDRAPFRLIGDWRGQRQDRSYLRWMYDLCSSYPIGSRNQVWMFSRQCEKSSATTAYVLTYDGSWKQAQDVQVGDRLVVIDERTHRTAVRPVTWKSHVYMKPGIKVRTDFGHEATFGPEHPVYRAGTWVPAADLKPGDRVGTMSAFTPGTGLAADDATAADLALARLLGWLVAEGGFTQATAVFTNQDPRALAEVSADIVALFPAAKWRVQLPTAQRAAHDLRFNQETSDWLHQHIPCGTSSFTHRVPAWVYRQGPTVRAQFLNRLWAGDGYVNQESPAQYEISYCSVNRQLCRDVQALLWGFGIPSTLRSFTPTLYKGTDKVAWTLRVITQRGIRTFLTRIGAFGKSEGLPLPSAEENNNRDVLPTEAMQELLDRSGITETQLLQYFKVRGEGHLHRRLSYPPQRCKIRRYMDAIVAHGGDVSEFERWLSEDVLWDRVESVERLPEVPCVDFTVDEHHNFIVEGLITHNSTTQAAKSILLGRCFTAYRTLYVAPRFDQVTVFSNQRFKPMAEDSVALKPWVKPSRTLWQVGSKAFTNGSFFNFRSCYLTADGCRGITSHHLMIDELQDILSDNVPVLEECQSHFGWETGLRVRTYAGTPKTNNNGLARRFMQSAQFQYLTRCHACNHANFPDEAIIGPTHYICVKCGREIFPQRDGFWDPQNRAALDKCWGFRLPQLVVPFKTHADIKEKQIDPNVSRVKFYNECLGLPYDEGEIVITETDLRRASDEDEMLSIEQLKLLSRNGTALYAGVDWGTGEGDNPSFTVLAIGHFDAYDRFKVRYLKRFRGKDAELAGQAGLVNDLCSRAGVTAGMFDWGFGAQQNARLVAEYGWDWLGQPKLAMQCMYVRQRRRATFDSQSMRYLVDRNQAMIDLIDSVKQGRLRFFRYESLLPFVPDFTTIYVEFSETHGTMKFDHVDPDDTFHAVNYAWMAAKQLRGQLVSPGLPDVSGLDPEEMGYPLR